MQTVNSVAIVGGGSAGWLTALTLNTFCPFLELSLVQPRNNEPIGVGESTQPDIMGLLNAARINIREFIRDCDATLKCGIYYQDWHEPGKDYWHPFSDLSRLGSYTAAHHYQQKILQAPEQFTHEDYYRAVHPSYEVCVRQGKIDPDAALGFHVDAGKLTGFIRNRLPSVRLVEMDDIQVKVEGNQVTGLVGDHGASKVKADLYIDCTGFNRAIIKHVSDLESYDYEGDVNSAVVAQIPYVDREREVIPFTRAHAHTHGWTWTIPLQTRIGSGYVYNSRFCTPEEAENNFRNYWGEERMRDLKTRHIKFNSTTLRCPWSSNVVAIGLSSGFVEPLEATSLNWIITSANVLGRLLKVRYFDEDTRVKYNTDMSGYIKDVQDFLDAHYRLSSRRDSAFWRYHTTRDYHPRLDFRLDLYRREMPNDINRPKDSPWAFHEVSWIDILNGYRFRFDKVNASPQQVSKAENELNRVAAQQEARANACKTPMDYIRALQGLSD